MYIIAFIGLCSPEVFQLREGYGGSFITIFPPLPEIVYNNKENAKTIKPKANSKTTATTKTQPNKPHTKVLVKLRQNAPTSKY